LQDFLNVCKEAAKTVQQEVLFDKFTLLPDYQTLLPDMLFSRNRNNDSTAWPGKTK